jgi:hypothetical protein
LILIIPRKFKVKLSNVVRSNTDRKEDSMHRCNSNHLIDREIFPRNSNDKRGHCFQTFGN